MPRRAWVALLLALTFLVTAGTAAVRQLGESQAASQLAAEERKFSRLQAVRTESLEEYLSSKERREVFRHAAEYQFIDILQVRQADHTNKKRREETSLFVGTVPSKSRLCAPPSFIGCGRTKVRVDLTVPETTTDTMDIFNVHVQVEGGSTYFIAADPAWAEWPIANLVTPDGKKRHTCPTLKKPCLVGGVGRSTVDAQRQLDREVLAVLSSIKLDR